MIQEIIDICYRIIRRHFYMTHAHWKRAVRELFSQAFEIEIMLTSIHASEIEKEITTKWSVSKIEKPRK